MHGSVFHRRHRFRVVAIVVAVPFLVGPASSPYYSNYSYYPSSQPVYVEQDPPADMEQQPGGYWYDCADPEGYYPYARNCLMAWMLVAR
jgi:hypothetical protein